MKNITSKKQLFLDFGRDYDASLSNFFFSKANEIIKNEIHLLMQSNDKRHLSQSIQEWREDEVFAQL